MSLRSDVSHIIRAHVDSLREANGKVSFAEQVVNFYVPLACGTAFLIWAIISGTQFPFASLIAGLTILFGFFLALVTFVFGLRKKVSIPRPMGDLRAPKLVDELFINCQYAVVISGLGTFSAILFEVLQLHCLGGAVLMVLMAHLVVLVMMCLKRLNRAYDNHKADIEAEQSSF